MRARELTEVRNERKLKYRMKVRGNRGKECE